jgi:CBS domain-containing protein
MRTHGVRRIPVVAREGEVVGIITLDDILRQFVSEAGNLLDVISKAQSKEQHARR